MDYLDFELRMEKSGEQYEATVVHSPAGEARHIFDWSSLEDQLERYMAEMVGARRDVRRMRTREMVRAREIGGMLFEAVFRNDVRASFVNSLSEARRQGQGLRLKLRVEAQELASVPWEYLYDRSLDRFLCLREETPVVRYIEMRERVRPLTVKPPLSILLMASCPRDYRRVDVEGERANLEQALGDLVDGGMVTMTWMESATIRSLDDHLLRGDYHVFHYIGHASFSEDRGHGVLALEDEEGRERLVSGERLAVLLGNHRSLRLVFLNACEGARTSQDDRLAGIAPTLMRTGGIPAVVAMQFSITDAAAIAFARGFYTALSTARPVDAAVIRGRMAMFAGGDDVEWGKPVLYMRAPDGILFHLQEVGERQAEEERLAELYARAEESLVGESWTEAIACCEEIGAVDAGYRDVGDLLARAREGLARQEKEERLARLYDEAVEALTKRNWQGAIDKLEQVVDFDEDYRDAAAQLTMAREGLAEAEAAMATRQWQEAVEVSKAKRTMEYLDFEVRMARAEAGYTVSVLGSPTGEATTQFTVPFSDLELENFVLKVGRTRRGVRRIGSSEWQAAQALGGKLFEAMCRGDVRSCFRSSMDRATLAGKGLRVKLRLLDAPELANWPWEYLYNRPLNRFLSLSAHTPVVRYIEMPEAISPLTVKPPLCILVMISSPSDYPPLDVDREKADLQEALGGLQELGMVELEWLEEASLLALQRRLRRGRYHIFHFIGHGGFSERAEDGLLLMEDRQRHGRSVSAQYLGVMLHDHRSLRLAVLNACEGARSSRTDPFAGAAMTLVQQGIPAVVAMQFEITDEAAIVFANEFYTAIADGYPVDASLAEARKAIFATGNDVEWGTPVLYMCAPDGRIFGVESLTPEEPAERRRAAEAAQREREEAAREREERLSTLYQKASDRIQARDWEEAEQLLCEIRLAEPNYRDVEALLAQIASELERKERLAALHERAEAHVRAGEWAQAVALYEQVLALDPSYPDVEGELGKAQRLQRLADRYAQALEHLRAQHWQEAIEGFRSVLELDPTHEEAAWQLARAQERQEAEERTRREEEVCQVELARLYGVADEAAQEEDWPKAIGSFQAVLGLDASYRDASARLAQAEEALAAEEAARGREARLADLYRRAIDKMEIRDWPEAEQLLHEIQRVETGYRNVEELLIEADSERRREEQLATLYGRAEAHAESAEWAEAAKLYGEVLALEPGYRDTAAKRAEAQRQQYLADQYTQALEHLESQRWQDAIEVFQAVVESDPNYADPDRGSAAALLARARQDKERAELPSPPVVRPRRPTTRPEEIGPNDKPRELPG